MNEEESEELSEFGDVYDEDVIDHKKRTQEADGGIEENPSIKISDEDKQL